MNIAFVINDLASFKPTQSTATLVAHCAHRGHSVWVMELGDLSYGETGAIGGLARPVSALASYIPDSFTTSASLGSPAYVDLGAMDLLWLRSNPGRDPERPWAHAFLLDLGQVLQSRGVKVLNDPEGLRKGSTKLYGLELSEEVRPKSIVTRDKEAIVDAVKAWGEAVIKPLLGSQGRDVFRVKASDLSNVNQIIATIARGGYVLAQAFVPEAMEGDTRVLLLQGEMMELGGQLAAVRRVPSGRDFRSNIHVGGRSAPARPDERILKAAKAIGPILRRDGIFLCGLDVIGGKIIEVNVFSPGGLQPAYSVYGVDFTLPIIEAAEGLVSA